MEIVGRVGQRRKRAHEEGAVSLSRSLTRERKNGAQTKDVFHHAPW